MVESFTTYLRAHTCSDVQTMQLVIKDIGLDYISCHGRGAKRSLASTNLLARKIKKVQSLLTFDLKQMRRGNRDDASGPFIPKLGIH
jgi:hypothetical protein